MLFFSQCVKGPGWLNDKDNRSCHSFSQTFPSSVLNSPFRKQTLPHRCVWNWTVSGLPRWEASAPLWKKVSHLNHSIRPSLTCQTALCKVKEWYNNQILSNSMNKTTLSWVYLAMNLCRLHAGLQELSSPLELWTTALQPVQKPIIKPLKSLF